MDFVVVVRLVPRTFPLLHLAFGFRGSYVFLRTSISLVASQRTLLSLLTKPDYEPRTSRTGEMVFIF
jgi:hypothetical protein